MDISVLRDFVIVIGGFLLLFVIILASILGFMIYRDIKSLTKSIKDTIEVVKQIGPNVKQATGFFKMIIETFKGKKPDVENKSQGTQSRN